MAVTRNKKDAIRLLLEKKKELKKEAKDAAFEKSSKNSYRR